VAILTFPEDVIVGVLNWPSLELDHGPTLATGRVHVPEDEPIELNVWQVDHVELTDTGHRLSGGNAPVDLAFLTQLPSGVIEALTLRRVVPSSVAHVRHLVVGLRRLYLSNCELGDAALGHISALSRLSYLQSYGNAFTDGGVQQLSSLEELEHLYLEEETLTAAAFSFATRLPKLKRLGVMDVPLTADQLATLRRTLPSVDVG
jgi:hypothetical protein